MKNMIGKFLKKLFGSRNSRIIKDYTVYVKSINDLEKEYEKKTDEELKNTTHRTITTFYCDGCI